MKHLLKQLKPHWLQIIVLIVLHMGQAYTTLLLPDYTSNLIDTGIQNGGFTYAVPATLTKESASELQTFFGGEELEVFTAHYRQSDAGHYVLTTPIKEAELTQLESVLVKPLAMAQLSQTMPNQVATQQVDALSEIAIHNIAIQFVKDQYAASGQDVAAHQIQYLFTEGSKMLVIAFLMLASAIGAYYLSAVIGAKIGHDLRSRTFEHVLQFSQREINKFSTASLITRSTNDIQQIQTVITIILRISLYAPILVIGGVVHVMRDNVSMTWIVVLAASLVLTVVGTLIGLTMPKFKLLQKQIDKVNLQAREILTGLQVIRAYGRQDEEANRFDQASVALKRTQLFTNRVMSLLPPLLMMIMNGTSVLIIWVAGHRIAAGLLQVGQMTAFISYTLQIIFAFMLMTMLAVMLPRAIVSAERVQEVLAEPLAIQDPIQATELPSPQGVVAFHNVSFRYDGAEADTLQDVNFVARPGETTAIIGSTGSGKSTVLNLLMRFYDVSKGRITIDGVDIRQLQQRTLRDLIGYIPQKGVLFSGTVASNIGYGVPQLEEAQMQEAASIAHASEFIEEKADGYHALVAQGGSNVSGGQKQRLSIARAIAKQPRIYLFDDSFSALDYRTDASLRQALATKTAQATVMIVAQRISTIINADQIIVLDEGRVVGLGTHLQLMETSQVYREIATSQLSQAELEQHAKGMEG
ncbi:ABC transporter ATP-binding protein/permease [Aerococcaceae bacterium NML180378]|nr:ABC transporter ATP-binding protein/permease [Aerococcaceae bacterium NML180378]